MPHINSDLAVALLDVMQRQAPPVSPNIITYNAVISACEKGGRLEEALNLLTQLTEAGLEPDIITYSALISTCEKVLCVCVCRCACYVCVCR
jgi:pentatricopeptide repeat protein